MDNGKGDGQFSTVPLRSSMNASGQSNKPTVTHKIVLLGDMGVGKTCISNRYYKGKFSD